MQRIQTFRLLIAGSFVFLAACSQEKVPTVSDYLHDIDSANAMLALYKTDVAKYQSDPRVINASAAMAATAADSVMACWPKKPKTTAGTDHACLDNKGYKR